MTLELTESDRLALVDALRKGAARNESYAKFYSNRQTKRHKEMARRQLELLAILSFSPTRKPTAP